MESKLGKNKSGQKHSILAKSEIYQAGIIHGSWLLSL